METELLMDCFTCFRRTENFLHITERDRVSDENVEVVFAKHFWFTKDDYQNRVVCTSCWERIDDFHKFYCQVEVAHVAHGMGVIKTEPIGEGEEDDMQDLKPEEGGDSYIFAEVVMKSEDSAAPTRKPSKPTSKEQEDGDTPSEPAKETKRKYVSDDDDDDDQQQEDNANDSDSDNSYQKESESEESSCSSSEVSSSSEESDEDEVPLSRRRKRGRPAKKPAPKKRGPRRRIKYGPFTCFQCIQAGEDNGQVFDTFDQMNEHFLEKHQIEGYVVCCNSRLSSLATFRIHVRRHETKKAVQSCYQRCYECNTGFLNEASYARHMYLVHTPEDQKRFKCNQCEKAFADEELLKTHISWHEEVQKKNFYCAHCDLYFPSGGNLDKHNKSHHGNETGIVDEAATEGEPGESSLAPVPKRRKRTTPEDIAKKEELIKKYVTLSCSDCQYVGSSIKDIQKHAQDEHQIANYALICCERRFSKRNRLYEHCLKHLNPEEFKCELCDKVFTDSAGLRNHRWWMHTPASERKFKCDICGDSFVKDYLFKQHMERHISRERRSHVCAECGATYTAPQQLKTHMLKVHGAPTDWVCDVCAQEFVFRSELERHRLTHTAEGRASLRKQCEKCLKWFNNKKNLLRHQRLCINIRGPAICDVCGHQSVNRSALQSHKRLHHSDKPKYVCRTCGKEFKRALRWKEHEANHAGIVLYKCEYCPRMCNSSSNMYTHKKTAHPEIWALNVAARRENRTEGPIVKVPSTRQEDLAKDMMFQS
ncbi:putative zinc finger protein 66 [Uranotaenia lowii]|uniref:putative zinc finger protein 66 n=1 Tax=Uranotaenia lowii TaxID=190385 RepID=UPI00247AB595|nr:putative zinc finger protein 66 [Uranotaenia lowii]